MKTMLVVALAGVTGCLPTRLVVQHEQTGVVEDVKTGRPVAGAVVTVQVCRSVAPVGSRGAQKALAHFTTDAAGRFEIPERKEWHVVLVLPDAGVYYNQRTCITAPGFRTGRWDPWVGREPWRFEYPTEYPLEAVRNGEGPEECFPKNGEHGSE